MGNGKSKDSKLVDRLQGKEIAKKYLIDQLLKVGSYAHIYRGLILKTEEIVAIKVIPKAKQKKIPDLETLLENEVSAIKACSSENIIRYIDHYVSETNYYIITEFCENGTLQEFMEQNQMKLSERTAIEIFCQILAAYKELHQKGITHRDIQTENILVHRGVFKLADFGFAKKYDLSEEQENLFTTVRGKSSYLAPEVLEEKPYGIKADIYSLGVLLYYMVFANFPYTHPSNDNKELAKEISKKPLRVDYPGIVISKNLQNLLSRMICYDQNTRISFSDLYKHQVVLSIEDQNEFFGEGRVGLENKNLQVAVDLYKRIEEDKLEIIPYPMITFEFRYDFITHFFKLQQEVLESRSMIKFTKSQEAYQFVQDHCVEEFNYLILLSKAVFKFQKHLEAQLFGDHISYIVILDKLCKKWNFIKDGFEQKFNIFNYSDFESLKDQKFYESFLKNLMKSHYEIVRTHEIELLKREAIISEELQSDDDIKYQAIVTNFFVNWLAQLDNLDENQMASILLIGISIRPRKYFNDQSKKILEFFDDLKRQKKAKTARNVLQMEIEKINIPQDIHQINY